MANLWGGSYGTRAASVYLRRHRDSVRSVVLDGVAPVTMKLPLNFPQDGQRAMDLMLNEIVRLALPPDGGEKRPVDAAREYQRHA